MTWVKEMTLDRHQVFSKTIPQPAWDPTTRTPWTITIEPKEAAKAYALNHSGRAVYTDGSSAKEKEKGRGTGVGFATVDSLNRDITRVSSINLPSGTPILEAEICAIWAALSEQWAHVTIFTDSQAALALLADENCKHPLIHECQKIARARPPYIFHLRWIPAHAGIVLHDVADRTAKQAGKKSSEELQPSSLPVSKEKTKQAAIIWTRKEACKKWKEMLPLLGRTARNAFPEWETAKLVQNRILQEPCYQLAQLLTAHCNLNGYKRGQDPLCRLCKTREDARHHVFVCKAYTSQREKMRKKCGGHWKTTFEFLITDRGRLEALEEYLEETGRLNL
jgi:ribonuclease HI